MTAEVRRRETPGQVPQGILNWHKLQSTPVETLVDMVSDRGSTPLASTTDCPKTRYFSGFSACFSTFSIHFYENSSRNFDKSGNDKKAAYMAAIN